MSDTTERKKIAVLGGGVGSMAAVFELTSQPDWQSKYDITVYQLGWRLGGKGASGRGPDGRIQEHGIHVWFGFYENAFKVMKACFADYQRFNLYPDSPIRTIDQAFKPQEVFEYIEKIDGEWVPWRMSYKVEPGVYPGSGSRILSLWDAIIQVIGWMHGKFHEIPLTDKPKVSAPEHTPSFWDNVPWLRDRIKEFEKELEEIGELIEQRVQASVLSVGTHLIDLIHDIAQKLDPDLNKHHPAHHNLLVELLEEFIKWVKQEISEVEHRYPELRHLAIMFDLAFVHIRGLIHDDVIHKGLASLNNREYTDWLREHGATDEVLHSALLNGLYDTAFCFKDGIADFEHRSTSAGTAIYGMLRMFLTWQGAMFFKMDAGMGDVIFAPLYAVLKARGVKFKFFHRVKNLGLSEDKKSIATISIARQVDIKEGKDYEPLKTYHNLPCWPAEPLYDQIEPEQRQKLIDGKIDLECFWTPWIDADDNVVLERGKDFDQVILGISLGAMPYICPELIQHSAKWADMVNNVSTVYTREYQLWFERSLSELGRPGATPLLMGFVEPGDVWTDMSDVIKRENWPDGNKPKSVSYFGGAMPTPHTVPPASDHEYPERALEHVKRPLMHYLNHHAKAIWPDGTQDKNPQELNWELLYSPNKLHGLQRLEDQYMRANISPTERYVQARECTAQYRLKPGDSQFSNLFLAGDWTDVGIFSFGCVESAAMSGMMCSRAMSGYPEKIIGEEIELA